MNPDLNENCDTDPLDDYVVRVACLHDKTTRVVANQRAVCDSLQRTAQALRRLAEVSKR